MQDVFLELWAIGRVRGRMTVGVVGDRRSKGRYICVLQTLFSSLSNSYFLGNFLCNFLCLTGTKEFY